jgi:hypothetical protein
MTRAQRGVVRVGGPCQRLFQCAHCDAQVVICGRCDRGNRYCGAACARAARRETQRAANKRYQATPRGRQLHAERQTRYRLRSAQALPVRSVTEQGRQEGPSCAYQRQALAQSCPVCGAPRTAFLRVGDRPPSRESAPGWARRRKPRLAPSRCAPAGCGSSHFRRRGAEVLAPPVMLSARHELRFASWHISITLYS